MILCEYIDLLVVTSGRERLLPEGVARKVSGMLPVHWVGEVHVQTLIAVNMLLFILYAAVMLANAQITGVAKGAGWFAASNLCRGGAMLVMLAGGWIALPRAFGQSLSGMLAVCGGMMLYRSFVELLERGRSLLWVQYVLVGVMVVGAGYLLFWQGAFPAELFLSSLILGIQIALTAAAVIRFSGDGDGMGYAGWMVGGVLLLYAAIMLMQAAMTLRYNGAGYAQEAAQMQRIWLVVCLLASSTVAFGFLFLSAAKLRVELLWRAQVDELTGLLNRWALKRVAVQEITRCRRTGGSLAVVMMDLDGLKAVNDELGHACGDAVLQAVAGALQETVRGRDAVARMGGDEFCVLLPHTKIAEAVTVAERLRAEVDRLIVHFRGETVRIRTSLGVASSEICGLAWQRLLDESDAALYRAKREGKNRVMVGTAEEEQSSKA
jgi:diguanylate cyclase (GGDEF)-like protein